VTCRPACGGFVSLRFALVLVAGLAVVHALTFFAATSDDAFITLRYARNLADGFGPVWNPGGEAVEGFSNPLFMLACALLLALGASPLAAVKGLGIFGLLASLAGAARLAAHLVAPDPRGDPSGGTLRDRAALAAALLVAATPICAFWSVAGLETMTYAATLVWALLATLVALEGGSMPVAALAWTLVALGRPEGAALAAGSGLLSLLVSASPGRAARDWGLGFLAPLAVFLAARRAFYGAWLANTFAAKVAFGDVALREGLAYLADFLAGGAGLLVLAALAGLALLARRHAHFALLAAGLLAAQIVFVVGVGGDGMPGFRFLVPMVPLLAATAGVAIARLAASATGSAAVWRSDDAGLPRRAASALGAVALAAFLGGQAALRGDGATHWLDSDAPWWSYAARPRLEGTFLEAHARMAEQVRRRRRPGDVLATTEAGVLPFLADVETVDILGLNDRAIALLRSRGLRAVGEGDPAAFGEDGLPRWPGDVVERVFAARPRWIMIDGSFEEGTGAFVPRLDMGWWIRNHPDFAHYEPLARAEVHGADRGGLGRPRIDVLFERVPEGF
jgi:arabinofuranosyltransferase